MKARGITKKRPAFERSTKIDPRNAEAFAGLGRIRSRMRKSYEDTSNLGKAVENLEAALRLDPSMTSVYEDLGNCYEGSSGMGPRRATPMMTKFLATRNQKILSKPTRCSATSAAGNQFEEGRGGLCRVVKLIPLDVYQYYQLAQMLKKPRNMKMLKRPTSRPAKSAMNRSTSPIF